MVEPRPAADVPQEKYPQQRLIVFAGMTGRPEQVEAFQLRKPEAWMASFEYVRPQGKKVIKDPWHEPTKFKDTTYPPVLDRLVGWQHYRYLDSGTFTFLRRALTSRLGEGSRREAEIEANRKRGHDVTLLEVFEHFKAYEAYLERHADQWDFVFECDVDGIDLLRDGKPSLPGVEFTEATRPKLREVVGDKLIPVWHALTDDPDFTRFKKLCEEYKYIGIGSDIAPDWRPLRYLIDYAHEHGVRLHGLGTSKVDVLERMPYDTVDSSTWISGARFGQYAGVTYTAKERKKQYSASELSRAHRLEAFARGIGVDPEQLLKDYETPEKYIVALALFQERQSAAPPITEARIERPSMELVGDSTDDEGF